MSCASCVAHIEKALHGIPGVLEASVNLATERAEVITSGVIPFPILQVAIEKAGYQAQEISGEDPPGASSATEDRRNQEQATLKRDLLIAAFLTLPVFLLEMGAHLVPAFHHFLNDSIGQQTNWWIQLGLTSAVLFGPGRRFFIAGVPSLLRMAPDMNSLVVLGTTTAFGFSVVATVAPFWLPEGTVHVYFEAAAVIVTLILIGRFLEGKAKGRTSQAIQRLVKMQPKTARVLRKGDFVELPIAEVTHGDHLQVRPGERIAVDGIVLEGK